MVSQPTKLPVMTPTSTFDLLPSPKIPSLAATTSLDKTGLVSVQTWVFRNQGPYGGKASGNDAAYDVVVNQFQESTSEKHHLATLKNDNAEDSERKEMRKMTNFS